MKRELHSREKPSRMGQGRLEAEMPCTISNINFRGELNTYGAFSYGNVNSTIYESDIGRFSSLAHDVLIAPNEHPTDWMATHGFVFGDRGTLDFSPAYRSIVSEQTLPRNSQRTTIGNDVWIGAKAFVRRGISIGDGAIVGACSAVVADVDPYTIVGGTPARVIRKRFDEKTIEDLLDLKWWNYLLSKKFLHGLDYSNVPESIKRIRAAIDGGLPPLFPPKVIFEDGKVIR